MKQILFAGILTVLAASVVMADDLASNGDTVAVQMNLNDVLEVKFASPNLEAIDDSINCFSNKDADKAAQAIKENGGIALLATSNLLFKSPQNPTKYTVINCQESKEKEEDGK